MPSRLNQHLPKIGVVWMARRGASAGHHITRLAVTSAPFPRHRETAAPEAPSPSSGSLFLINVIQRVAPVRNCPSLQSKPPAKILAANITDRNDSVIAAPPGAFTADRPLPDMISQSERCLLPAMIPLPIRFAELTGLRRIDAEQADSLAVDFNGVAVDD